MHRRSALLALLALPAMPVAAMSVAAMPVAGQAARPIGIVAAENFYGDVAQQIGGAGVRVTSIISNPDQDPHLFEVSPSVARAVAGARIVVYNGLAYDPWMAKLLRADRAADRSIIVVADLAGRKPGDNPHIWYDPTVMRDFARALSRDLSRIDPARQADYRRRLARFERSLQPVRRKIAALRARLAGTPVTATEPVFGYMFAALGMRVRNLPFQIAVMNNTEPSASQIAGFETDLKARRVRLLVYNAQAARPMATRMARLARASRIPVVGATETEPPGTTYQAWMLRELDAIDRALPNQPR